jgi:hypothetical protein
MGRFADRLSLLTEGHVATLVLSFSAELAYRKGLFEWILRRWAE